MSLNNRHKAKDQLCVYCSSENATERDHVPPKSFFTKPLPPDLIVVPICTECNRTFGKELDEQMRGFLIQRMAYRSKTATLVWKELVLEGLRKNRRMAAQLKSALIRVETRSPGGLFLGNSDAVVVPGPLFQAFIRRLVRGLHWQCFGDPLDETCQIEALWVQGPELIDAEISQWIDSGPLHAHAGGQFKFKVFGRSPDDSQQFWIFELHGQVFGAARCSWPRSAS